MAVPIEGEIVFVVDVSSFTEGGFVGTSVFEGQSLAINFDDRDEGAFLTYEMARRLGTKIGSTIAVLVEADKTQLAKLTVAEVGNAVRFSDAKVYYAIGNEGGAIVRISKT